MVNTGSGMWAKTFTAKKIGLAIGGIIVAALIFWLGITIINSLPGTGTHESTPSTLYPWVEGFLSIILGTSGDPTWEEISVHFAVFIIILFGLGELIMGFSSFSEGTSLIIGFGLAIIAGATKTISILAGIFGIAAGIGGLGIGIIIITAILSAVVLNVGVGGPLRKWRAERQKDISSTYASTGSSKLRNAIRGLAGAGDTLEKAGKASEDANAKK